MNLINKLSKISDDISVLYVEDEDILRASISNYLKKIFSDVKSAKNGKIGLEYFLKKHYDIVITDIQMPEMNGFEMKKKIRQEVPNQEIIIATAFDITKYLLKAISLEVSGYILKPIEFDQINKTLYKIVNSIKMIRENEEYKTNLEEMVEKRTAKNLVLEYEMIENYEKTILSLVEMVERRDTYTGGHSLRVAQYSKLVAQKMNYSKEECELIYKAGTLHDIGKIETPDAVLLNPNKLDDLEYAIIKEHPKTGMELLNKIPMYKELSKIVAQHHERYDGAGYPKGLKKDEILPLARIMIVTDAFDAMITNRVYKPRKSIEDAIKELKKFSGSQFHPKVVDVAIEVLKDIKIDENIFQLPSTAMDNKKFAFFFEDQTTKAFNQTYLNLMFIQNQNNTQTKYICVIFIHHFNSYNKIFGWDKGDIFLKSFVNILHNQYNKDLIFRLHGDDFVIISDEKKEIDFTIFDELLSESQNTVTLSYKRFNTKNNSIKSISELEELLK